ncbi:hypothetical protein ACHAWC_011281 [Mediolabrus comicus]
MYLSEASSSSSKAIDDFINIMANINRKHPLVDGNDEDDRRDEGDSQKRSRVDDFTPTATPTAVAEGGGTHTNSAATTTNTDTADAATISTAAAAALPAAVTTTNNSNSLSNDRDVFRTVYIHMGNEVPDPNSITSGSEVMFDLFSGTNGDDGDDPEDDLFHRTDGTGTGNGSSESDCKRFYANLLGPEVCNNITGIMKESETFGRRKNKNSFGFAPTTNSYFSNEGAPPNNHGGNERHYYSDQRDYLADMAIMKEIQVMLTGSFGRNQRGFFYFMRSTLANILGRKKITKDNWDMRIARICCITGYPRNLLNIIVEAKANVTGPITFVREQEEFYVDTVVDQKQCKIKVIRLREEINMTDGVHFLGHLFVNDYLGVDSKNVHFRARCYRETIPRYVLFVESEETAGIIRSSMFFTRRDTPGVVVCGKGYPPFYARFFIRMMMEEPWRLKVFACSDVNPHGLQIIERLTSSGLVVNAPESELCKFENVWWAGPFPTDVVSKLSQDSESYDEEFVEQLQHWTSNDEDTLQSLLNKKGSGSFVNQGSSGQREIELELMHQRKIKVEGEAFEDDLVQLLHSRIGAAIREEEGWDGKQVK